MSASFFNELETKNELCSKCLLHFLMSLKQENDELCLVSFLNDLENEIVLKVGFIFK
jgi:hypothetical protein